MDIREVVETPGYIGPTKSGVRFTWDKLKQFSQLAEVLLQQLGVAASAETTLFPDMKPQWVSDAKETLGTAEHNPAPQGFDATSLKSFPVAFLPDGEFEVENIKLPTDRLRFSQDRGGPYFVTDESGFQRQVRSKSEGKFFLYAHQRGSVSCACPRRCSRSSVPSPATRNTAANFGRS